MELRQLQYFVAVAEELSFTRAATGVRVAQPAISQQIARLEREVGQPLFDRSDRRVRLTSAGEAFLPHARAALAAAAAGQDAVRSLGGLLVGRLIVGAVQAPPPDLARRLGAFAQQYPHVRLTIRIGHPEELTEAVATGGVDVAALALAGQQLPASIETRELSAEPLVLAVPAGHPLSARSWVSLAVLAEHPVVTMSRGGGLRAALDDACVRAGVTPRISAEADDVAAVGELVAYGDWVAVLPLSVAQRTGAALTVVPLRRPALHRRTVLAWRRHGLSAPAQAFVAST